MSDNPYATPQDDNPFTAPATLDGTRRGNPLLVPAIFLLVLSAAFGLYLFVAIGIQSVVVYSGMDLSTAEEIGRLIGMVTAQVAWLATNAAILLGSIAMIRMKGYRAAMVGAICAVIPVCTPCFILGIPFGIWAIVVMRDPQVRRRFES